MSEKNKEDTIYFRAYPGKKQVLQNLAESLGGTLSSLMNGLSDGILEIDAGARAFLLDQARVLNVPVYQVIEWLVCDLLARRQAQIEVWGYTLPEEGIVFPSNGVEMVTGPRLVEFRKHIYMAVEVEQRLKHLRGELKRLAPWLGSIETDEQKAAYEAMVNEDDRAFLEEHGGAAKVLAE